MVVMVVVVRWGERLGREQKREQTWTHMGTKLR